MKRIANHQARSYVEQRVPFRGSNLYAHWLPHGYVVYSYGPHWPLLINIEGQWFANEDKYSRSTSRHFSQCRPLGVNLHWLSANWMRRLAAGGIVELIKARVLEGAVV